MFQDSNKLKKINITKTPAPIISELISPVNQINSKLKIAKVPKINSLNIKKNNNQPLLLTPKK